MLAGLLIGFENVFCLIVLVISLLYVVQVLDRFIEMIDGGEF